MSLNTLENQAPPLFKQGLSATSRLLIYSALAIFLMVSDKRFAFSDMVRSVLTTALTPLQFLASAPLQAIRDSDKYFDNLAAARKAQTNAETRLLQSALRVDQVEQLTFENHQLRQLLNLSFQPNVNATAAEVLYDVPDPFSRKVMLSKGSIAGIVPGSPVLAVDGVLGQVTRVHPNVSEVTLLTHRDHGTPVVNVRTGFRSIAYGVSLVGQSQAIELRFVASTDDIKIGDILNTSGIDGVYPAGLGVAKVEKIELQADAGFARIYGSPLTNPATVRLVLVLQPLTDQRVAPSASAADTSIVRPKAGQP